jgi:putative N6-adenine-specific DNA methylase
MARGAASGSAARSSLDLFAISAPGLESLTALELGALGVERRTTEPGGVSFSGTLDAVYRANLHLRTASRVLVRAGEFHARAFGELERRARQTPWEQWITAGRPVRLRVTCRKSRLYHSDAVAERLASAIESRLTHAVEARVAKHEEEDDAADDAQLIIARIAHDRCTLSIDSSGALLHQRGYRQATAKAPLRETLAAALLLASEWNVRAPLLDPMCGAGTIAIEGALMARRIAPGLHRRFAFMAWPDFNDALWRRALADAEARALPAAVAPVHASDRDAGAIAAARSNAERAGVARDIELHCRALSAIEPPAGPGWMVTNPPYGVRVGERERLRNLYAQLGHVLRRKCPGWTATFLSADRRLETETGLALEVVLRTRNGGIPVRGVRGIVSTQPKGVARDEERADGGISSSGA